MRVITSAVNSRSSIDSTRTMPNWRHTPSNTRSSPTSAPVCACADRAVTSDRPIFSTTIGLAAAIARRAAAAKLGAWRIVSANSAIARTSGWSIRWSMKCAQSRSASLPVEIMCDRPISCCAARLEMKLPFAPLWVTTAIEPGLEGARKPPVHSGTLSMKFTKPRQLGPSNDTLCWRANDASRAW